MISAIPIIKKNQNKEPINEKLIRAYRLRRTRDELARHEIDAVVLYDPINIRYVTGSRNMQVWTMHNLCRYVFLPVNGSLILFDYGGAFHLSHELETIDEQRPAISWDYFGSGERAEEHADHWANEIASLLTSQCGKHATLAVDRLDLYPLLALQKQGIQVVDAKAPMAIARAIKSDEEIKAIRHAYQVCELCVSAMRNCVVPGVSESLLLAELNKSNIKLGGEYQETRLLSSGSRTNPWFQETSDRILQKGDFLAFDTDLIGLYGIFTDMSRTWVVGDVRPTDEQRRLYTLAREQLEYNISLLKPGLQFHEMTENAWNLPEPCIPNRYPEIIHGDGLAVEYPLVYNRQDKDAFQYSGFFEVNMVVCVESYICVNGGHEGVKLEQPVLITKHGAKPLITYPFEETYH